MRLEATCEMCGQKGPIETACQKCSTMGQGPAHLLDRYLSDNGPILHVLRLVVQDRVSGRKGLELLRDLRRGKIGPGDMPMVETTTIHHKRAGDLEEGDLFRWQGGKARAASVPTFSDDGKFVEVTLIDGDPLSDTFSQTIEDPETIGVAVELEMIGE